ncbi:TPA: FAD-binding oxidoreductase [Candidatus Saccharibacteria bacterium]|nr:FAD-binding oxidoreductase [Candidatus Saccharibacteria bacterium]HIO87657.1 FAD-binding oxidoreductase [Candidatus Saccharibacteria bacterium]
MSKLAEYLQQHISGDVIVSKKVRDYFSTDGSVFEVTPKMVVYPLNTTDVRKTVRFSWQLAEKGKVLPITARGRGTDQAGGALGDGIMMVFPAHMNKIIQLDRESIIVQPGENYAAMQKVLKSHGRFMPPYPSSIEFSTIGGAVANNAAGEMTLKYGATKNFVKTCQVVLANGEVIDTRRITKRELNKKMGGTSFESEIYRQLDSLIMDNWELIHDSKRNVSKNSTGYDLTDVKRKDGSFDLTPLIVGSQGTLGVVTEITLRTEAYTAQNTLIAAHFDSLESAGQAVAQLLPLGPAALEFVDKFLLELVDEHNSKQLEGLVEKPFPKIVLLIEFDDNNESKRKRLTKKAKKILEGIALEFQVTEDPHEQEMLWKLRRSAAAVMWHTKGNAKALPIIEDGVVPQEKLTEFIPKVYALYEKYGLDVALWGHAGNSNIHMQPFLDLTKTADRQKVFRLMDDYYGLVMSMGGSTAGEHNDGRLRAPYLKELYGEKMYDVFAKVKKIFDPYGILNPGVKIGVSKKDLVPILRKEYSMEHLSDHLPRSHR